MIKLVSWNVNGIRAVLKKNFMEFVDEVDPDILCLQETRGQPDNMQEFLPNYHQYWNHAQKKGYSGSSIYVRKSKKKQLQVNSHFYGMNMDEHDQEGRITGIKLEDHYLLSVYTPNSGNALKRLAYRQKWDQDFLKFATKLNNKKPLIICGDLNVAHKEIDLTNPKTNRKNAGFTDEERLGMSNILENGFLDSFRMFNADGGHYTWWSYRMNARARIIGWRIDYFLVSRELEKKIKSASILKDVYGSDHCPVQIILK